MKTLLFVAVIFFASCSGEDDPAPKYDCKKLESDANQAHVTWQAFIKTPLNPNASQAEKDKYLATNNELKNDYTAKVTLFNQNCK